MSPPVDREWVGQMRTMLDELAEVEAKATPVADGWYATINWETNGRGARMGDVVIMVRLQEGEECWVAQCGSVANDVENIDDPEDQNCADARLFVKLRTIAPSLVTSVRHLLDRVVELEDERTSLRERVRTLLAKVDAALEAPTDGLLGVPAASPER